VQAFHKIDAVFDDPNLIGSAGLVPVMRLAERAGLHELLAERLSVPSANAAVKASCVVAGMLAGADSIDDLDVLRHGAASRRHHPHGTQNHRSTPQKQTPEINVGGSGLKWGWPTTQMHHNS